MRIRKIVGSILLKCCVLACLSLNLAKATDVYVSNYSSGTIFKITAGGVPSTFATGLDGPKPRSRRKLGFYFRNNLLHCVGCGV